MTTGHAVSRRRFLAAASLGGAAAAPLRGVLPPQKPAPALPVGSLKPPAEVGESYWWKVRSQYNLVDGLTFMNNGTLGPVPRCVAETAERCARELAEDPTDPFRGPQVEAVRGRVARFVGADPDEIVLTRSTTEGMTLFAHGLDWRPGDEVIVGSHEFQAALGAFRTLEKRSGIRMVRIEHAPSPRTPEEIVDGYRRAMSARTRLVVVSHITFVTGTVMPIAALADLAHAHGALISVDGAHPLGMIDLNVHELRCDHYAASGQKWLQCGTGTGVCYIRRDLLSAIRPLAEPEKYDASAGARKFEEFGHRNVPSVLAQGAAVEFQETVGKPLIEARCRALSERLRSGLREIPDVRVWTPLGRDLSAALTLFSVDDIPMKNLAAGIMEHSRIYVRTMSAGGLNACRASTHFFNLPEEVERLIDCVRYISANAGNYKRPEG